MSLFLCLRYQKPNLEDVFLELCMRDGDLENIKSRESRSKRPNIFKVSSNNLFQIRIRQLVEHYWITGNSVKCERIIIIFYRVRIRDSRLMSGVPPPTLQRLQILKTNLPSTTIAIKPTHSCQRRMELYVRLSLCHHLRLSLPLNVKLAMKTIFISVIGILHFSMCSVF